MNPFDTKSYRSFQDVIDVYHDLKSRGYSDEALADICGFLHDVLKLYLSNVNRESESKPINFNKF